MRKNHINFYFEKENKIELKNLISELKPLLIQMLDFYFKNITNSYTMSCHFKNSKQIHKLNSLHRKKEETTDVLSFPLNICHEHECDLGDIFINHDYLFLIKSKLEMKDKLLDYFIHSFLHLNNYDHQNDSDYEEMEKKHNELKNFLVKHF